MLHGRRLIGLSKPKLGTFVVERLDVAHLADMPHLRAHCVEVKLG